MPKYKVGDILIDCKYPFTKLIVKGTIGTSYKISFSHNGIKRDHTYDIDAVDKYAILLKRGESNVKD